jgi:eukaryotic-like serine/threonine-protein kinase
MIGQAISHYSITEKLGEGGMGVVYRAHDLTLHRDVALKFLSGAAIDDPMARVNILTEARTISALNHPNICTIYEVSEAEGKPYLAMEFIEGRTLSMELTSGGMATDVVVRYGMQLADALAHAHERGIVHRDLKAANVIVTPSGRLKVLDFGLSRRVTEPKANEETTEFDKSWNEQHAITGTLPYIAPEILRGQQADPRSDIWALGVLLYEMASGKRPFRGGTAYELSAAILRETPPLITPPVQPVLQSVIDKCLDKDPGQRYRSGGEVRAALEAAATASRSERIPVAALAVDETALRAARAQRRLWYGAGAFVVTVALVAALAWRANKARVPAGLTMGAIQSLAVLPLENLSGDPAQDYFSDGMTDEIITNLAHINALRVISRTSTMHYKGTKKTLPEIAGELHVDAVVEGSVLRDGNHLRVTAQLIQAPTDTHIWAQSYQRDISDVLAVQDEVARAIAAEIRVKLTPDEEVRLTKVHTTNFAAHDAYLRGRYHLRQGTEDQMREAKANFEEAINRDPNYPPAYAGLADYYWLTNELSPKVAMPKAKEYVQRALALDENLADAHSTLGSIKLYGDWDWPGAEREFKRTIELSPSDDDGHRAYALFLSEMGRHEQALTEIRTAQELDPLSDITSLAVGWTLYYARQYDRAIEQCSKVLDLDPKSLSARDCLGSSYLATGAYDEAVASYQALAVASGNDPLRLASLGCAYALSGKRAEAQNVVAQIDAASKNHYVPPYLLGMVHAALGEKDKAFVWLEKAYDEHDSYLVRLKAAPSMDSLRSDPRFGSLLQRMKL